MSWVYRARSLYVAGCVDSAGPHESALRHVWEVGFFSQNGEWESVRNYERTPLNEVSAQDLVHYLNGGDLKSTDEQLRRKFP